MSIKDLGEKIKSSLAVQNAGQNVGENGAKYYTSVVIILVGLSSFGLGRLSVQTTKNESIKVEKKSVTEISPASKQSAAVINSQTEKVLKSGQYVASKNGSKYYFPWCGGANNISEANKVWFDSVEEAKSKGYSPASNCKGLK